MSIQVTFNLTGAENLKKLTTSVKGIRRVVEISWHKAAREVTHHISNQMYRTSLSLSASGKYVSSPGAYPAVQSGALVTSISYQINGWQGFEIGSYVLYGEYLEQGTSKMAARPFLKPGIEESLDKIERILLNNLKRIFK